MKKYLPIKVHHIYFGYGWWWGSKVYFRDKIYGGGIFIVPLAKECKKMVYANNGKLIGDGMVMSWEQSRQREAYGN